MDDIKEEEWALIYSDNEAAEKKEAQNAIAAANKIEQDALAKRNNAWGDISKTTSNFESSEKLCERINEISTMIDGSELDKTATSLITETGPTINEAFGEGIKGGQPMTASGRNNDCLIHSFLTAMCDSFRTYPEWKRVFIADVFRRKILPEFTIFKAYAPVLKGKNFLSDDEADKLASLFKITIVLIVNSDKPEERYMIVCKGLDSTEYIVINGNHTHFTPVQYMVGGKQTYKQELIDIESIQKKATEIVKASGRKNDITISWNEILEDFKKDTENADVSLLKGMYASVIHTINKDIRDSSYPITQDEAKDWTNKFADIFKEKIKAARKATPNANSSVSSAATNVTTTSPASANAPSSGKPLMTTVEKDGKKIQITVGAKGVQTGLSIGPFTIGANNYYASSVTAGGTRKRRSKPKKTRKRIRGLKR